MTETFWDNLFKGAMQQSISIIILDCRQFELYLYHFLDHSCWNEAKQFFQ